MNAKKLMVGLVTAVTLTLFTAAAYAQQLAAPQEATAQTSYSHQEEHGGDHGGDHGGTHEHHGHA
jgi:hypothetical protein